MLKNYELSYNSPKLSEIIHNFVLDLSPVRAKIIK
jgi:hypothetical protein